MIIATVPYLNALPLVYFLKNQIIQMHPSDMIQALLRDEVDVALLPVYEIIKHHLRMHPQAGLIGCDGTVKSVGFFLRNYLKDLKAIKTIYFDRESVSSVYLAKILLKKFIRIEHELELFHYDNRELADAQLLIGDKVLESKGNSERFFDLGELWKEYTGAGFIFAAWASKRSLSTAEIRQLEEAKGLGLKNIDQLVLNYPLAKRQVLKNYLTQNVIYEPLPNLKQGMKRYHEELKDCGYL